jgi:hypothetical protein
VAGGNWVPSGLQGTEEAGVNGALR